MDESMDAEGVKTLRLVMKALGAIVMGVMENGALLVEAVLAHPAGYKNMGGLQGDESTTWVGLLGGGATRKGSPGGARSLPSLR